MTRIRSIAILGVLAIAACSELPVTPTAPLTGALRMSSLQGGKSYVLIANNETLPANLSAAVSAAGGTLTSAMSGIGVAAATSSDPNFAAKLKGFTVVEDVMMHFDQPRVAETMVEDVGDAPTTQATVVGAVETFRAVQWAPDAISAPAAWGLGDGTTFQGLGARVAVLDGGIHSTHIDIAPNLDVARSKSFVPSCQAPAPAKNTFFTPCPFNYDQLGDNAGNCLVNYTNPPANTDSVARHDTFWHGTHVAGIVAAPAQNIGTVGIAPKATIVGVKVLHCGIGSFSSIIQAIVYAANPISEGGAGANIINMSLGAGIVKAGPGVAHLLPLVKRAIMYAHNRGVTIVAAAGNDAVDLQHAANLVFIPAETKEVISVSATAPMGWALPALGTTTPTWDGNFDRPASYTNFGKSAIDFAAPGGDFQLPGNAVCSKPRFPSGSGSVVQFCWVFDGVFSSVRGAVTSNSSYNWAAGTSMASPAVAGVAALIVGQHPGISPDGVRAILERSADQLGTRPGKDAYFGAGRVNAFKAVQQ